MGIRTVVVTGASGFLGRAVIETLVSLDDFDPVAVSRTPCAFHTQVRHQLVEDYAGTDMPDDADLVHLAETAALGEVNDISSQIGRKTLGKLIERCNGFVVYASSVAVYGDQSDRRHGVQDISDQVGKYAEYKLRNEKTVLGRGGAVLRLSNLYGPDQKGGTVIGDILKQLGEKGPLKLSDKTPVRDFLWVDDAAAAFAAALRTRKTGLFNVAAGESHSVEDVARMVLEAAGEGERSLAATAPGDGVSRIHVDISGTTENLGWTPQMSFHAGLATLVTRQQTGVS